ncbi:hypothetical protein LNP10_05165 [Apilactobacillus nanyangensis]|uniref:beta-fructofuranosidase n=1 Tax=Apilactobacillus nanyangensis TaxID=2799579 RepID=A0ABT0HY84_9LACO|nr:hypothetical protein [Apilactobacillus nanyangensis]MCK8611888.1 hypothetical protein [Apilactobacillus nanyangensis]
MNDKFHYKMYKSREKWVVIGIIALSFAVLGISNNTVAQAENVPSESNKGDQLNNSVVYESKQSAGDNQSNQKNTNTIETKSDDKSQNKTYDYRYDFKYGPTFDTKLNQNYHYNNPQGYSNDIQSIVPKFDENGKVRYWELYYLSNQYPNNYSNGNSWYGLKTSDFVHFTPLSDENDATSKDNVAIPDAAYIDQNGKPVEVSDNNKNGIPWGFVATGSVIQNDAINGRPLFSKDEWGNSIDSNAKLAFVSTFGRGEKTDGIFLAYSNNDNQFHPYSSKPALTQDIVGHQESSDFRDPYVTTNGHNLIMYVAGGVNQKMFTLTSSDGINWKHSSKDDVDLGGLDETPNIQTVNGQTIMFFSAQPGIWYKLGYTKYVTGHFDDKGIFKRDGSIKNLDDGFDYYAGNFVKIDNDTVANIGWLGSWIYTINSGTGVQHAGSFTMPRVIQYNGKDAMTIPIEPGQAKLESTTKVNSKNNVVSVPSSKKVDIDYDGTTNKKISLVRNDHNSITISFKNNKMTVARKEDKNVGNGMNITGSTSLENIKIKHVVLYVDNSSVEIFLPQLKKMFTVQDVPNEASNQPYSLTTDKSALVKISSFSGNVDSNYINNLFSSINDRFNQLKSRQSVNANYVKYVSNNLSHATTYISKANDASGDATANVYLAIANYYLSNANYWNDVLDGRNNVNSSPNNQAARTLKSTKRKLSAAKRKVNSDNSQLAKLRQSLKKRHSKKTLKKIKAQYKKQLKKAKTDKKAYTKLLAKEKIIIKYSKSLSTISKDKKYLKTTKSKAAKAKKTVKRHNTKKNRSAYSKLVKRVNSLNRAIRKAQRFINSNGWVVR